ncbi:MAG: hypothetical protein ABSB66_03110 [Candidatus Acidiferrales bacterium]|jgi:hypothetical protein
MRRLPRRFFLRAIITLAFFAFTSWTSQAQSTAQIPAEWNEALDSLADKIAAAVKPAKTFSLSVKNISSLSGTDVAGLREELVAVLAARKFRITEKPPADAQVRISFSESEEGYLWVAEIRRGDSQQVEMVSARKANAGALNGSGVTLTVQRNLLQARDAPFLDFSKVDLSGGRGSLWRILEANELTGFGVAAPIRQLHISRDPRGRLRIDKTGRVEAHVGEIQCISVGASLIECSSPDSSQAWVFEEGLASPYVVGRNYFAGFTSGSTGFSQSLPPFFSAATFVFDHGSSSILTELDGKARLYESAATPTATFSEWGDDIAPITATCGSGWHVLVTGTGDWTQTDEIQVYELKGHQVVASGPPLKFPGPILALWASEDGKSARAVSRNLQTGEYEASIVSVSCGD